MAGAGISTCEYFKCKLYAYCFIFYLILFCIFIYLFFFSYSKKASGIPDFRSPSSGLYTKLCDFDLPYPEAIFELSYFREHPEPFFALAKELYPKTYKPTPVKKFKLQCLKTSLDTIKTIMLIFIFFSVTTF